MSAVLSFVPPQQPGLARGEMRVWVCNLTRTETVGKLYILLRAQKFFRLETINDLGELLRKLKHELGPQIMFFFGQELSADQRAEIEKLRRDNGGLELVMIGDEPPQPASFLARLCAEPPADHVPLTFITAVRVLQPKELERLLRSLEQRQASRDAQANEPMCQIPP